MFLQTVFQISQKNASSIIKRFAFIGLTISVAVVCIGSATINGFSEAVSKKMYEMLGSGQISSYSYAFGSTNEPANLIAVQENLPNQLQLVPITELNALLLKGNQLFQANKILAIDYKAVPSTWQNYLVDGDYPQEIKGNYSQICINQDVASQLSVQVGDTIVLKFPEQNKKRIRQRNAIVSGIMNTGVEEFSQFAIWPRKEANRFLNVSDSFAHSILCFDINKKQVEEIQENLDFEFIYRSTEEIYPNVFQWLDLQASNEWVIGGIIAIVAFFNCMSMAYVYVVERRVFIALFRVHGASSKWLAIELFKSLFKLNLKAVLFANLIAILISVALQYGKFIPLEESTYYINFVPAKIVWWKWLAFDGMFFLISFLSAYLPYKRFSRIEVDILASENRTQMA